jgi:glycosyltransferase involved in cell wall biosynthesis
MKISIITPTLNQSRFIEDTILTVKNQDYPDFEHIVIDGGSTDGTIEILKKYPHLKWISEKDTGQSNAINKGLRMATGDILAWLNSDDYYDRNIFKDVAAYFENHPDCFFLYGNITYIDETKKPLGYISGETITYRMLLNNPDLVRQPSCFWRKDILQSVGYLNEQLHVVMDYDYFLRIGKQYQFHYLNRNLSFFRSYPQSKTSALARRQAMEIKSVMKTNAGFVNFRYYAFMLMRRYNSFLYHARQVLTHGKTNVLPR